MLRLESTTFDEVPTMVYAPNRPASKIIRAVRLGTQRSRWFGDPHICFPSRSLLTLSIKQERVEDGLGINNISEEFITCLPNVRQVGYRDNLFRSRPILGSFCGTKNIEVANERRVPA